MSRMKATRPCCWEPMGGEPGSLWDRGPARERTQQSTVGAKPQATGTAASPRAGWESPAKGLLRSRPAAWAWGTSKGPAASIPQTGWSRGRWGWEKTSPGHRHYSRGPSTPAGSHLSAVRLTLQAWFSRPRSLSLVSSPKHTPTFQEGQRLHTLVTRQPWAACPGAAHGPGGEEEKTYTHVHTCAHWHTQPTRAHASARTLSARNATRTLFLHQLKWRSGHGICPADGVTLDHPNPLPETLLPQSTWRMRPSRPDPPGPQRPPNCRPRQRTAVSTRASEKCEADSQEAEFTLQVEAAAL